MEPITTQVQVDIENCSGDPDVHEPLLPLAKGQAAAGSGAKTTNCCMIACCAPLGIKNGGGSPEPKPDTPTEEIEGVNHHAAWGRLFKLNVVLTFAAAVWFGGMAIEALANDSLTGEGRRRLMHQHHGYHHHHTHGGGESDHEGGAWHLSNFIVGGVALLSIASLVSAGMLHSLFHCGRGLLRTGYAVFVGLFGVMAMVLFMAGQLVASAIWFAICACCFVAFRRRKLRIQFGQANLKVASLAIKDMPWTYRSAILMGLVQLFWCTVAGIAALGSFVALETVTAPDGSSHPAIKCLGNFEFDLDDGGDGAAVGDSCTCSGTKISDEQCQFSGLGLPLMIVWLCSMAWGCSVIKNVVACTVSGSVASWWFSPHDDGAPVKGAFHRATTTSFGSLCKAAAVQQVLTLMSAILQRVLRVVPCAVTLMSWADKAARYVIAYTIAFVGIYGLNFNQAGARVRELFQRRGVTALANDVVVEMGLALLAISTVMVYFAMTGVMLAGALAKVINGSSVHGHNSQRDAKEVVDSVEFWSVVGPHIFAAFALVFLMSTVLEVVRSGYKAVFVCFVQDPETLAEKHGHEIHAELTSAWQQMHNITAANTGTANTAEGRPVLNTVDGPTTANEHHQ